MLNKLAYRTLSRKKFPYEIFLLCTNKPYVKDVSFTNDRHTTKSHLYLFSELWMFSQTLSFPEC